MFSIAGIQRHIRLLLLRAICIKIELNVRRPKHNQIRPRRLLHDDAQSISIGFVSGDLHIPSLNFPRLEDAEELAVRAALP